MTDKLLLALASKVILGSEFHGTHDHSNQSPTQSQSYLTTGGLPAISSSWRQAP
jgi:hypothetical protein